MANWCTSSITICGNSNEIKILWNHLNKAISIERAPSDFGPSWLGNLVVYLGSSWEDVDCRGTITYLEMKENNKIIIKTETAWAPLLEPFRMLIEKYAPKASMSYVGIEPNMGLYLTNDSNLAGKYIIDDYEVDVPEALKTEKELEEEELREIILGIEEMEPYSDYSTEELIEELNEIWEVYIYKFEYEEL